MTTVPVARAAVPVAQPRISLGPDLVVGEGDGTVSVPVRLSAPGQSTVTVQYQVFSSTAVAGSDFVCPVVSCNPGTLTFAPGETVKTVTVALLDDAMPEGMESFFVDLSTPSATGTLARAVGHVTIVDNDTIVATPQLFVRSATVDERAGTVRIPVVMGGPAGQASTRTVSVQYSTQSDTAVAPADYTTTAGTLTFAAGRTVRTIVVPIINDTAVEPAEQFTVALSTPVNATIADGTGTVVIGASDATRVAQPRISIGPDMVVGEGDGYVDVPVTLSAPGQSVVTVPYQAFSSTADSSTDFVCPVVSCNSDTLTFAPGETTKTVRVDLREDAGPEPMETFFLDLFTPSATGTLARAVGHVAIVDNDNTVATPRLFVRNTVVDETASTATVPVMLGGPGGQASNNTVTVQYSTQPGTGVAPDDFTATTGTLRFAPGQTVKNVVVGIVDDTAVEPAEQFTVALSTPVNATIADGTGTVRIGASDAAPVAQPAISAGADVTVPESIGYLDIPVTMSRPSNSPVQVQYSRANGTATGGIAGPDYVCPVLSCNPGTLTFAPGETTKTVRIDIIDDPFTEPAETFALNLTNPTNATITRVSSQITIAAND